MKEERRKRRHPIRNGILLLLVVILVLGTVMIVSALNQLQSYAMDDSLIKNNSFTDPNAENYTTLVLYGVDSRENDLAAHTRSDSIMVVSIHKRTHKLRILSIFRDTYVSIEGHGFTKINHAYAYGGPELSLSTINQNFDLNCKDFVTVNFSALTNAIDALGGITLTIEKNELKYVNAYTRDVARINQMDFTYLKSAGEQTVTGTQATGYSRVRYTQGGDYRRAERQRTVVQAMLAKAKKSNPLQLYRAVRVVLPQICTNLSKGELLWLGKAFPFYSIDEQQGFPFDKEAKKVGKMSVVLPRSLATNVSRMHEFLYGTKNYSPSQTVQNYSNEIAKR